MNNEHDFTVVDVEPVCERGSDVPSYYRVTARLHGVESDRGVLAGVTITTWLGIQQIDGSLSCTGWVDATQWVDATAERVLGVKAAVELGERILTAAVL